MSATNLEANVKALLPFDVLSVIFLHYVETETRKFPLETLLLVCRTWHATALEHKQIWSIFNVVLESKLDMKDKGRYWCRLILRRLGRSGAESSGSPIYFKLRCPYVITFDMKAILHAITGEDGALCLRWREMDLNLGFGRESLSDIIQCLSYPTPQLTSLTLISVKYLWGVRPNSRDLPFLPSVPALRKIHIEDCLLPRLPSTEYLTDIRLFNDGSGVKAQGQCLDGLQHAEKVENLEVSVMWKPYTLPQQLIHLRRLVWKGELANNIAVIEAPNLRELQMSFYADSYFPEILGNPGIPVSRLDTLVITSDGHPYATVDRFQAYRNLLRECHNLKRLAVDIECLPFILKVLQEEWKSEDTAIRASSTQTHLPPDINNLGNRNGNNENFSLLDYDNSFTVVGYVRDRHRHLESTKSKLLSSDREKRLMDIEQFAIDVEWYYLSVDIAEFEGNRYGDPETLPENLHVES